MSIPDKLKKQLEKMYARNGNKANSEKQKQGQSNSEQNIAGQGTVGQPNLEQNISGHEIAGQTTISQESESTPEQETPDTYAEYLKRVKGEDTEPQTKIKKGIADYPTESQSTAEEVHDTPSQVIPEQVTQESNPTEPQVSKNNTSERPIHQSSQQKNEKQTRATNNNPEQLRECEYIEIPLQKRPANSIELQNIQGKDNKVKQEPVQLTQITEDIVTYDAYVNLNEGKSTVVKNIPNNPISEDQTTKKRKKTAIHPSTLNGFLKQ